MGRGGVALLIHPNFTLLHYGTIPGGLVAWAHIKGPLEELHCASIYGAGTSAEHSGLWRTLHEMLPHGD